MSKLEKLLAKTEKETVSIKLSECTFAKVASILGKGVFHAQNPEDSLFKCDSKESFALWRERTLLKYPNAWVDVTVGGDWFGEVRISDPFFQTDKARHSEGKMEFLKSSPKY